MSCGVYKITNLINNKIYVGQSKDIEFRWKAEKAGEINQHAFRAFKKYGIENFSFEIIIECLEEELDKWEIHYIDYYNSCNPNYGYNKLSGGYNGKPNDEIKEKISNKLKEFYKNNPEALEKLSKIHKGKIMSKEHKESMIPKISKENNYQWVERTQEMISDVIKLTTSEWCNKYNHGKNIYGDIKRELNLIRDDRKREITIEMIKDAELLTRDKFSKKYQCGGNFWGKIRKENNISTKHSNSREITEEMIKDVQEITCNEFIKKYKCSSGFFLKIRKELGIKKEYASREITEEMIVDAKNLSRGEFYKKYKCGGRVWSKIRNGDVKI